MMQRSGFSPSTSFFSQLSMLVVIGPDRTDRVIESMATLDGRQLPGGPVGHQPDGVSVSPGQGCSGLLLQTMTGRR